VFASNAWQQLANTDVLCNDKTYQRYAVTFVDNHDTFREQTRLRTNVCAANAYILTMPGTPCLFLKNWQSNKGTLKRLIALRKAAAINNQSDITASATRDGGAAFEVKGTKGSLVLCLGNADLTLINVDAAQYTLATEGKNYKVYASNGIDLNPMKAITDEDADPEDAGPVTIPDFCTVAAGETCAFYEAPTTWGNIKCWRWDNQYNYTGNKWPGVDCTLVGTTAKGRKVWKWTYNPADRKNQTSSNQGIIFTDGSNQTADLPFRNAGYYTLDGLQGVVGE
jgi:alpha-amylase